MTEQNEPQEYQIKHGSLGLAVKANDVEDAKAIVKLLEDRREYITVDQWTDMLFKTLETMEPEMAAYLVEKGADINASLEVPMQREEGRTQVISLGYCAVLSNNRKLLDWMIQENWVDEKMLSPSGDTLLVQALRDGAFEIAEFLHSKGMSIDHQNLRGVSSLHEACSSGNYLLIEWLMERKANPTLETMAGAVACELVPEEAEDMKEAEDLFQAVDDYMIDYRNSGGNPKVSPFITKKANEIRKMMEAEKPAEPEKKKKISVSM